MTVTAPDGTEWVVDRVWFALPAWSRREPSDLRNFEDPGWLDADLGGGLVGIVVGVAMVLVLFIVLPILLPLLFVVFGAVAAFVAFGARLASLSTWQVRATAPSRSLNWSVRGVRNSRRAMRSVGAALTRGEEPTIGGRPGYPAA